jgi:hypothetical protein
MSNRTLKIPPTLLQARSEMVAMLALLFSPEGIQTFTEIAENEFVISWGELTADEARAILFLLGIAESFVAEPIAPNPFGLMPPIVAKALHNVANRLGRYRPVLEPLSKGKLSSLDAVIQSSEIDFATGYSRSFSLEELNQFATDGPTN